MQWDGLLTLAIAAENAAASWSDVDDDEVSDTFWTAAGVGFSAAMSGFLAGGGVGFD